jgi:hypothetical protein
MRDAYEIFKNTYVNDKQQSIEKVFTKLAKEKGATSDLKIIPLEPIGLELSEAAILTVAPREWILEKAGIDITQYQNAPQIADGIDAPQLAAEGSQSPVNDSIKNMTGRQYQQVLRIIRQFGQGKITKEIATTMLKAGLGLTDAEINTMLGVEEEFGQVYTMDETIAMFSEVGTAKSDYTIVQSSPLKFEDVTDEVDKQILSILNKQPLTPAQDIAAALKRSVQDIQERISSLITRKIIEVIRDTGERKLTKPLSEIVDAPVKTTFEIKYSYEWKPGQPANDNPSRAFCTRLLEIDKFWTRKEIEALTQRLGYSVFDRAGGWWGQGAGKAASPSCRHEWRRNVLIKKTK